MKDEVLFIEGCHEMKRPDSIPESWTIYNAPRPLLGHERWQAGFRHGIFYAAVTPVGDPADEFNDAPEFHRRNRELDGHVCVWIGKEHVMEYGKALAREYNVDLSEFDYQDIVCSFLDDRSRN